MKSVSCKKYWGKNLFEFMCKLIFPFASIVSTHLIVSLTFMEHESSCLHLDVRFIHMIFGLMSIFLPHTMIFDSPTDLFMPVARLRRKKSSNSYPIPKKKFGYHFTYSRFHLKHSYSFAGGTFVEGFNDSCVTMHAQLPRKFYYYLIWFCSKIIFQANRRIFFSHWWQIPLFRRTQKTHTLTPNV